MAQRKRARERRRSHPRPEAVPPVAVPRPAPATAAWRPRAAATVAWIRVNAVAAAAGGAVVAAAFAVYFATAARDIVFGDTPELTAVALTLGVAHPPGYPIFTVLGWLFGQLPIGPLPFRVALLSVVCHAATVGVVYGTTYRFTRSVPGAAVAAASLAFTPLFWSWSLVAEVFPLNDLLSATMLLLVALWHEHPERKRLLVAGGLVGGLGMADHQTIALLSPAVLYVMWRRRDVLLRDPRVVLNAGVAFAIGLVPYLELLVAAGRRPFWSWGDLRTPGDLLGHFLRQSYGTGSLLVGAQFTGGSPLDRIVAFASAFDPLQWVLLAVGTAYALRAKRWYATYVLIAFVLSGPAFAVYSNANLAEETTRAVLERFFLMPQVAVAPLAGFAVVAVGDLARRSGRPPAMAQAAAGALGALAAVAFVPLDRPLVDQSDNHLARILGNDVLSTLKPGAILLGSGDPIVFSTSYLQTIEGARPDVTNISMPLVVTDWYIRELRRMHPDLVLRDDRYGPPGAPIRSMLDANRARPIAVLGELPDNSTDGVYWFYSRGMLFEPRALTDRVLLEDMTAENERILASYHPPRYGDLVGRFRAWERLTLVDYAQAYYRVGLEYERGADSVKGKNADQAKDLYAGARSWYLRALDVNPTLREARDALARVDK